MPEDYERKRQSDRAYAAAHREEARQRAKAWYYANKERAADARAAWYANHKKEISEYNRRYRAEKADSLRVYEKARAQTEARKEASRLAAKKNSAKNVQRAAKWASENPERVMVHRKNVVGRRRARLKSRPYESIDPMEVYRSNEGICGLCGKPVAEDVFELDHIKPIAKGGGHLRANVHIAHRYCNKKKGASTSAIIYSL